VTELTYFHAIILGIIQGLTEFLPISSSGHLALAQRVMEYDADSPAMLLFDVAVHLGTVVAVAAVFAGDFGRYFRRLCRESTPGFAGRRTAWRIAALGIAASVPTAVIGLVFKDDLEAAFGKPSWIGIALIMTGSLLWATGKTPRPRRGWRRFGFGRAVLIGLGQGIAILPGVSRSGTTISLALLAGIRREWAGQFSFFIAIPAICGAALLHTKDVLETGLSIGGGAQWAARHRRGSGDADRLRGAAPADGGGSSRATALFLLLLLGAGRDRARRHALVTAMRS
jgi:undecaprenyl-diphosphatase